MTTLNWIGAGIMAVLGIIGAVLLGKETAQVKLWRAKSKEARAVRLEEKATHARAAAKKAKTDAEAQGHIDAADTMQLKVVDLRKARAELTGDLSKAAREATDEDYAADFNRRHATGRNNSAG